MDLCPVQFRVYDTGHSIVLIEYTAGFQSMHTASLADATACLESCKIGNLK